MVLLLVQGSAAINVIRMEGCSSTQFGRYLLVRMEALVHSWAAVSTMRMEGSVVL